MDLNENEIDGTLLLKYINETANSDELKQIENWLAEDESYNDVLLQVAQIHHAQHTRKRIRQRDPHRALTRAHQKIKKRKRRIIIRQLAVAASLLIGALGMATLIWQNKSTEIPPQMITVTTNAGMRSHLILPDSTVVHLNAGSTLVYPSQYDKNERRVLLSGEAYFKVAHNAAKPFVVNTADDRLKVQVLGTELNLQAYKKDGLTQITLIEGSVQVGIKGKRGCMILTPSDRMTYNILTEQVSMEKTNTAQITAWMDGRLMFKDTPMPEVLRQLTHFFSVDFEVQDKIIREYSFTGTFENRPLFQILDYLKISSGIEYTMAYPENQEIRKPVIHLTKRKTK